MSFNASSTECEKQYTEFARSVLVEKVCPNRGLAPYEGSVFNKMYNRAEDFYEKYCENTPEILCLDEMKADAKTVLEAGKKYLNDHEELSKLVDAEKHFDPIIKYLDEKSGLVSVFLDRDFNSEPLTFSLSNHEENQVIEEQKFLDCNKTLHSGESLTCLGKLEYGVKDLYHSVKGIFDGIHLNFVSMCLERSGFGRCELKQFVEAE